MKSRLLACAVGSGVAAAHKADDASRLTARKRSDAAGTDTGRPPQNMEARPRPRPNPAWCAAGVATRGQDWRVKVEARLEDVLGRDVLRAPVVSTIMEDAMRAALRGVIASIAVLALVSSLRLALAQPAPAPDPQRPYRHQRIGLFRWWFRDDCIDGKRYRPGAYPIRCRVPIGSQCRLSEIHAAAHLESVLTGRRGCHPLPGDDHAGTTTALPVGAAGDGRIKIRPFRSPPRHKPDSEPLDQFVRRKGGINACAARFSRRVGRYPRCSARG
jgi:hypothetical protein